MRCPVVVLEMVAAELQVSLGDIRDRIQANDRIEAIESVILVLADRARY